MRVRGVEFFGKGLANMLAANYCWHEGMRVCVWREIGEKCYLGSEE